MELLQMTLFIFINLLLPQPSLGQQPYYSQSADTCNETTALSKGYSCNPVQTSCQAFVSFQTTPSYTNLTAIASILGSDESSIAAINKLPSNQEIPINRSIIVPIYCSCSGNIFQHYATYSIQPGNTYYLIANQVYPALTSCAALIGQNYYFATQIPLDVELTVPIRCACPSRNQTADGVTSLLVYQVKHGNSIRSIAKDFGVSETSILEANMLSETDTIYGIVRS